MEGKKDEEEEKRRRKNGGGKEEARMAIYLIGESWVEFQDLTEV